MYIITRIICFILQLFFVHLEPSFVLSRPLSGDERFKRYEYAGKVVIIVKEVSHRGKKVLTYYQHIIR